MTGYGEFSVDPDRLEDLRRRLSGIVSEMADVGDVSGACYPSELGRGAGVWNALQAFDSDWSNGIALIKNNMEALLPKLASAARDYVSVDRQVAAAAPEPGAAQ